MNFNPKWCITNAELGIRSEELSEEFELVILDRYQTPQDELLHWKKIAPVIGIDEGGLFRDQFDFLVDILIPEKLGKPPANIYSPALLFNKNFTTNHHEQTRTEERLRSKSSLKILITFGQEDSAGLGLKTARMLSTMKSKYAMDITLLRGALAKNKEELPENVRILECIPNLAEHLCEYDLVITHYGITAYEALYAGTPVLLAHPTKYHKKLAKAAGFSDFKHLNKFLNTTTNQHEPSRTKERLESSSSCGLWLKNKNETLCDLVDSFLPKVNRHCPVCGAEDGRSISRFNDRTYRRCFKCGIICMNRINPAPIEYEKEYFFDSYKKQYGKTYLEDFDNIKQIGKRRMEIISHFSRRDAEAQRTQRENKNFEDITLLDIGCAYGPFLAAAKEAGFSPTGLDPAEDAVKYVQEKLGFPAIQSSFPIPHSSPALKNLSAGLLPTSFDVITLWFVIEHFTDCVTVLNEIKKLLKPSGILAFSTPSFSGISGRSSLRRFLSASPADHWTVWSPKMAKKALALAGFKVKKITVIGHHPQRFPFLGKFAKSKKSPVYWVLLAISKILGLGDSFEVYAQYSKSSHRGTKIIKAQREC
jgi:2-polyprenyl-3-methyl-5-hydroxy-6-metoxy-1,4-benzoquinol methylase/spore coat polysaccharide biosynthesis predicted glycosyltransferase SpsG